MRAIPAILAAVFLLGLSADARARCTKDTDCKGDRICVKGACAEPSQSAAPSAGDEPAFFKGAITSKLTSGELVPGQVEYIKRTLVPAHSDITERIIEAAPAGGKPLSYYVLMKVKGAHFTLTEGSGAFKGDGELVGKPWKWTGWASRKVLPDGTVVESKDTLVGQKLRITGTIKDAHGNVTATVDGTFWPTTEKDFQEFEAAELGPPAALSQGAAAAAPVQAQPSAPPPVTCTGGAVPNGSECVCNDGKVWTGSECACANGQNWTGTECACTGGSAWDGNQCSCQNGMNWNGSQCACTGMSAWNGWACECQGESVLVQGVCQCPGMSNWDGHRCQCPQGYRRVSAFPWCEWRN